MCAAIQGTGELINILDPHIHIALSPKAPQDSSLNIQSCRQNPNRRPYTLHTPPNLPHISNTRNATLVHISLRNHGGVLFLDIRDASGLLQAVSVPGEHLEAHARAERLRQEYVVRIDGELRLRKDPNPKMPTGAAIDLTCYFRRSALSVGTCCTSNLLPSSVCLARFHSKFGVLRHWGLIIGKRAYPFSLHPLSL